LVWVSVPPLTLMNAWPTSAKRADVHRARVGDLGVAKDVERAVAAERKKVPML